MLLWRVNLQRSPNKRHKKFKKKQLKCNHCDRINHDLDHCFALHLEKRPIFEKEKTLEAMIAELEERLNIVASLGQVSNAKWTSWVGATEPSIDPFMFSASWEMVAAAATRTQSAAKLVMPTVDETRDIEWTRHSGSPDHIGQARLPLSFGLADTTSHTRFYAPSIDTDARAISGDSAHTLAYKVLQMLMFSCVEMFGSGLY